jgi:predicted LPLAT superfamily acyltransferase
MTTPAATAPKPAVRNPGPNWGYQFLRFCDLALPEFLFRPLRAAGTWVAVFIMPRQRGHSLEYLTIALGRRATFRDVFRHFFELQEALMIKLRVANGRSHEIAIAPGSEAFETFLRSGARALLGTFHVGHSDLQGFLLGPHWNHPVYMVRQRVGNSHDTDSLGALFGQWLKFIWVAQPEEILFALKEAVAAGGSIAMKCDRVAFSARLEAFEFFGARRLFPFTIYQLSLIFGLPVLLSVGLPAGRGKTVLHSSPPWSADPALGKAANLMSAHKHFQDFLRQLEAHLRRDPYQWFNFLELNPVAPAQAEVIASR